MQVREVPPYISNLMLLAGMVSAGRRMELADFWRLGIHLVSLAALTDQRT